MMMKFCSIIFRCFARGVVSFSFLQIRLTVISFSSRRLRILTSVRFLSQRSVLASFSSGEGEGKGKGTERERENHTN